MNNQNKHIETKAELPLKNQPNFHNKPYKKPKLQRLGDLRSLTLGATGNTIDTLGNLQP